MADYGFPYFVFLMDKTENFNHIMKLPLDTHLKTFLESLFSSLSKMKQADLMFSSLPSSMKKIFGKDIPSVGKNEMPKRVESL